MEPSGNQKAILADLEADKIAIGQHVVYVNGKLECVSNNREEALIYSLSIKDRKNNKVYYQLVRDPTLPDIVYKV